MDVNTCVTHPYITADYESNNTMNGNNINVVYIDEEKRIWLANYPTGVTIVDNRYKNYYWIKHSIGNQQSLVTTRYILSLRIVMEICGLEPVTESSLYNRQTKKWHSFLSYY